MVELVRASPKIGIVALRKATGFGEACVLRILTDRGWGKKDEVWVNSNDEATEELGFIQ